MSEEVYINKDRDDMKVEMNMTGNNDGININNSEIGSTLVLPPSLRVFVFSKKCPVIVNFDEFFKERYCGKSQP